MCPKLQFYHLIDDQHLERHVGLLLIQPWVKSKCYTFPAVGSQTVVEEHRRDVTSRADVLSGVTTFFEESSLNRITLFV